MTGKLSILWTAHLANNSEKKKDFEAAIEHSREVLDRLNNIVVELEEVIDRIETSPTTYNTGGWPYTQAFYNGKKAAYKELKQLLKTVD